MPWPGVLLLAGLLDAWAGDPRWDWHPVRLMGRLAMSLEHPCRKIMRHPWCAGVVVAFLLPFASALVAGLFVLGAGWMHPVAGGIAAVLAVYATIAGRDMLDHAHAVLVPLNRADLPAARGALSRMVGRETEALDEAGIARATVESIAEGLVDGVVAPIFWALVGGILGGRVGAWAGLQPDGSLSPAAHALAGLSGMAMGAVVYRAANTLDSTFGYKTEAHLKFGWASARLDDAMNWVPARLGVLCMVVASACLRYKAGGCLRTWWLDGGRHESPNAGQCEAGMAGALGVELGGACTYGGEVVAHPRIGRGGRKPGAADITDALRLFRVTLWLVLLAAVGAGLLSR